MLFSRSLMSAALNFISTLALSLTWPECSKNPTPELNSTTRFSGKLAGFGFFGPDDAGHGDNADRGKTDTN